MTNDKIQMSNKVQMSNGKVQNSSARKYDLIERTAKFGEDVIDFVNKLEKNDINRIFINQLIRSSTSIGANYMEADGAESKRDFRHKIIICKKEAKETRHWFRMINKANPTQTTNCAILGREVHELALIFSAICLSSKEN